MKRILALLVILGLLLAAGSAPAEPLYKVDMTKLWPGLAKKADPSPAPAGDDFARFGGVWTLTEVTSGGQAINPAEMGMTFILTLRQDGTLIADIVLQLLSYVAEMERAYIKQRQAEGIAAAKLRGVRFGAPPKERTAAFYENLDLWNKGQISARAAAKRIGIHYTTFLRWANK